MDNQVEYQNFRVSTTEKGYAEVDGWSYEFTRHITRTGKWSGWIISKRTKRGYSYMRGQPTYPEGFPNREDAVAFIRSKQR